MPMKPNDIYAELVRRGLSAAKVARSVGMSNQTVMNVIHGKSTNSAIRSALAKLLEKRVEEVFGAVNP